MMRVIVFYPNKPGAEFDYTYYTEKHIPIFKTRMRPFGLVRVEIDKGIAGSAPGAPPPYVTVALCVFNSLEELQKGFASHNVQEILADIPNFTNLEPQLQLSEILE
jgi:uncharacterized protein (TIGR02118 family)